jgi:hypothetical protein
MKTRLSAKLQKETASSRAWLFSPQRNYTCWVTTAGGQILVQISSNITVSRGQRDGSRRPLICFIGRSRWFSFKYLTIERRQIYDIFKIVGDFIFFIEILGNPDLYYN